MKQLLSVGIGGCIGSILRYLCSISFNKFLIINFPIGTLLVNIIGCFLIGLLINNNFIGNPNLPYNELIIIGILGGFTTYSAFGLETYNLIKSGMIQVAILYVLSSIIFGLIAIYISRKFNGNLQGLINDYLFYIF